DPSKRIAHYAMYSVFFLLIAAPVMDRSFGLIDQAFAQRREEFRGPAAWSSEPALRGVYVSERESYLDLVQDAETREQKLAAFFYANTMGRKQDLRAGEYMQIVMAGVADLKPAMRPGESVVTLDMSNPFPFILGARPAKGSWLPMENNRTFSQKVHPAA